MMRPGIFILSLASAAPAAADGFVAVPVPAVTIAAGEMLTESRIGERRYRLSFVERNAFARDRGEVVGLAAARTLPKGRPIAKGDLRAPFAILEGADVSVRFARGGLSITMRLTAMDGAALGEPVRLRNRETGRIVSATATGENTAELLP
jgi:flagella basal body P-ring formation protein FlgA